MKKIGGGEQMRYRNIIMMLLIVLLTVTFMSCGGKHPADVIAPGIMKGTDVYQKIEEKLVQLYDIDFPGVRDNWQTISNVRWKASKAFRASWKAWYALSQANTPTNLADFNTKFLALTDALIDLAQYIPSKDPQAVELQAAAEQLKLEASK